ncbi:GNAT family N-acetyltransferase [Brevibacillus ginsengisoli]|uniref:GNAT family N-acetyltransferase n=1 Tax=Brevibacillus ginsengisoli TaxID=363854 RepID=UPI003CEF8DAD
MMIELQHMNRSHKDTLRNLFELYTYDFSEYMNAEVDDHGRYSVNYSDQYLMDESYSTFLVLIDGRTAGFAVVKADHHETFSISQFFIMRKYRRTGAGKLVATKLFDQYRGNWRVAQIAKNLPAQAFWRKVIAEYTKSNYTERYQQDRIWSGPVQEFNNR